MTPKNARTEARGFLVKFAGRSAEFQWEIVLIHGGQISPVSTRDRLKLGRGGVRCRSFCPWANQKSDLLRRITGSPKVFDGNGRLEKLEDGMRDSNHTWRLWEKEFGWLGWLTGCQI